MIVVDCCVIACCFGGNMVVIRWLVVWLLVVWGLVFRARWCSLVGCPALCVVCCLFVSVVCWLLTVAS